MSIQKPIIGNQGTPAHQRSLQQGQTSLLGGGGNYPGLEVNSFNQPLPANFQQGFGGGGAPGLFGGGGGGGGLFGGGGGGGGGGGPFNIAQIKQVIDRLGGIEGIMSTVAKIQRIVQNVQQMAPMIKVLMDSFGKKKESTSEGTGRRKRRKRKGAAKRSKRKKSG
ncbi:hypothetical protein [Paenibacillus piri]|uniref:Uncharacterized protein n=1 Tax=Paenibacillus piri TaxID=2547395 RepID=A0A4R5KJ24_9BACL|nr:hypothetical protein [Paenibacillus piri]TDF95491.1 hypothetical protein E1757_20530 [Paenibacillus piri]